MFDSNQGRIQRRAIASLKPTQVTLFTMILKNSENSICDIRPFCRPFFLSQQSCEVYFISLAVVNLWWNLTAKHYWNRPSNITGWIRPWLHLRPFQNFHFKSDLSKIFDSDSLAYSEWSLAAMNFVATNTQWKLWYTARSLCFNKSFIRNCTDSTGIPT